MDSIHALLASSGYITWRMNIGGLNKPYTDKFGVTRKHYIQFNQPGMSDLFAIQKGTGKTICIEVKRPSTRKNVTFWQQDWINRVNEQGGIAFVACSSEEVCEKLGIKGLW